MKAGYLDSTPPQVARVVGGWILGIGIVLFALTFQEIGRASWPTGAIAALVLLGVGGLALVVGSRRLSRADEANRRFFAQDAGTDILAARRRSQALVERVRLWLFLALVAFSAWWVFLAGTLACAEGVCTGFLPAHVSQIDIVRWICISIGSGTLMVATLARVHANETDRWEELASDFLRRRDDGSTPGLQRSRWE